MPIDYEPRALDLAQMITQDAGALIELADRVSQRLEEATARGIDWSTVDFSTTALKDIDATTLQGAITVMTALTTFLGQTGRRGALLKVRR